MTAPVTSPVAGVDIASAPEAPAPQRPRMLVVAALFGSLAVAMGFIGMLGVYLAERAAVVSTGAAWLPEGVVLPLTQPNVMFFGLVMSSVTMQWAYFSIRRDDTVNGYLALGLTVLFGVGYVNMMLYLWSKAGLEVGANIQSVLIYSISGAHMVMAGVAMVFVALMAFRALAGGYGSRQHDGIAAAAVFWHVMVAIYFLLWIAIFVTR